MAATDRYRAEQHKYIEMPEAQSSDRHSFLDMLAEQRRALFFKIPDSLADELELWHLTVFTGAGDYLTKSSDPLETMSAFPNHILARLVNGLNRIFSGLLVFSDRELLLATEPLPFRRTG